MEPGHLFVEATDSLGNTLGCLGSPIGLHWPNIKLDVTQYQDWKLHLVTRVVQLGQRDFYATCLWTTRQAPGHVFSIFGRLWVRCFPRGLGQGCPPRTFVSQPCFFDAMFRNRHSSLSSSSWIYPISKSQTHRKPISLLRLYGSHPNSQLFSGRGRGLSVCLVKVRWRPCGHWGKCSTWPCYSQSIHIVHQPMG